MPLVGLFAAMPVTAVASILHRATGIVLFAGALYLCWLLDLALGSGAEFQRAVAILKAPLGKFGLWLVLASLAFHLFAGLRHLLLDFHVGDSLRAARIGTWVVIVLAGVAAVLAGAWLW